MYQMSGSKDSIAHLKGSLSGRPVLIVGNGPSLKVTPMDAFLGVPAIGMNKIDLLYEETQWRPSLVISANNVVVKQHWRDMLDSGVPIWLPRKARYFVPPKQRQRINWFHVRADDGFQADISRGTGRSATVTFAALQFAYYMEADPVILFGVDHSFQTGSSSTASYVKQQGPDVNHFDPRYFADQWWGTPDLGASERSYRAAKAAFSSAGRRIFDATIGGKLEVFDKIELATAIALANQRTGT